MNANDFWQKRQNLLQANEMGFYSRTEFINRAVDLVTEFFSPEICPIDALNEFLQGLFKITDAEIKKIF